MYDGGDAAAGAAVGELASAIVGQIVVNPRRRPRSSADDFLSVLAGVGLRCAGRLANNPAS